MAKMFILLMLVLIFPGVNCFAQETVNNCEVSKNRLFIKVSVSDCRLWVYEKNGETTQLIKEYKVATAKKNVTDLPLGLGEITAVELKPHWKPTKRTIAYLNQKLIKQGKKPTWQEDEIIKPGDKRNAMGSFKMLLSHQVEGQESIYRIHGTNQPKSIGTRASRGCIRMLNEEGLLLAKAVKERLELGEKVEVEINR